MILVTFVLFSGVNIVFYLIFKRQIMVEKLVRSFEDKSYILQPMPDECVSDRKLLEIERIFGNLNTSGVFCVFGVSGSGKSFYLRQKAKEIENVLYFGVRIGQDFEAELYHILFDRDSNLALKTIDVLYRIFSVKKLFPEKRTLEMIFNLLEEDRQTIYDKFGNRLPMIILDNVGVLVKKEERMAARLFDYIKHIKDNKYLNVVLASDESGRLNSIIETRTFSRIDNFIKIEELANDEIQGFVLCCMRKARVSASSLYRELVINTTTGDIGGSIHHLQILCSQLAKRSGKSLSFGEIMNRMIDNQSRDFQYCGIFLGELGFVPELLPQKTFLALLHTMMLLIDKKGPLPRQKVYSKVRHHLDIEKFPSHIFLSFFSSNKMSFL